MGKCKGIGVEHYKNKEFGISRIMDQANYRKML